MIQNEPMRQQLSELYATARLRQGEGLPPAALRLLRRVQNLEALRAPAPTGGCELGGQLFRLAEALRCTVRLHQGWLQMADDLPAGAVGLPPERCNALLLNLLACLLGGGARGVTLHLTRREGRMELCLSARCELSLSALSTALSAQEPPELLPDFSLTVRTAAALAAQGGGRVVWCYGDPLTVLVQLPLRPDLSPLPCVEVEPLVCDRFSPVHLLLEGFTVPPDFPPLADSGCGGRRSI